MLWARVNVVNAQVMVFVDVGLHKGSWFPGQLLRGDSSFSAYHLFIEA